ncbi:MAG: hypothetical protein AAB388_04895 [Patescibacteria group bacterium]
MPSEPQIKLLPYKKRQQFFGLLLVIFVVALPTLIFYTTGHRLNLSDPLSKIITTGGMYVTTNDLNVDVYLDEKQFERPRLFRSAYYIQNIETGQHRVVVQREGLYTWVKELPIDPYMVVEAAAFNMPLIPHIRPIAEYETATGTGVFLAKSTSTVLFPKATTTTAFLISAATANSSYVENEEYPFVQSLFSTSTATSTSVFSPIGTDRPRFRFSTTTATALERTLDFVEKNNMRLEEQGNELVAIWQGSSNSVPFYFCVTHTLSPIVTERYGTHVAAQVEEQRLSTTTPLLSDNDRVCRSQIKIDRKRKDIYFYDFFPGSVDLVLIQLEDGLYVTEIDDRAWQNTQLIYPGSEFKVVINNQSIFIAEAGTYFELLTEIEDN